MANVEDAADEVVTPAFSLDDAFAVADRQLANLLEILDIRTITLIVIDSVRHPG